MKDIITLRELKDNVDKVCEESGIGYKEVLVAELDGVEMAEYRVEVHIEDAINFVGIDKKSGMYLIVDTFNLTAEVGKYLGDLSKSVLDIFKVDAFGGPILADDEPKEVAYADIQEIIDMKDAMAKRQAVVKYLRK